MPIYKCEKCNKTFNRKSGYGSHIIRIKPCVNDNNINNECIYCNKSYSTRFNLNAHLKNCKEKPIIDDHTQEQIEDLKKMFERKFEEQQKKFEEQQKKIEEQQKQINDLSHVSETNNNITVNNENSHNTTTNNTINIYSSGKEDLTRLSQEDILKLCTSGTYYPIIAAEILHCNEKYPEFQNVLISNLRATTGLIKINDKWVTKSQDELLNNMMRVDKKHISTLIKDLEVEQKHQVKLESTQDEIDMNEPKEHHKDKIKQKLYDASNMIKKHKKQSEKH
jgi:hypothetical protein